MRMLFIAGIMITLPAIIAVLYFFGRPAMFPALASLLINFLPFAAAIWFIRNRKDVGDEMDHH